MADFKATIDLSVSERVSAFPFVWISGELLDGFKVSFVGGGSDMLYRPFVLSGESFLVLSSLNLFAS